MVVTGLPGDIHVLEGNVASNIRCLASNPLKDADLCVIADFAQIDCDLCR